MNSNQTPYIKVENIKKYFKTRRGMLHAVDDVSFEITQGKTLGLVGESGCGKSTLGRCLARLLDPTSGRILFNNNGTEIDITKVIGTQMQDLHKKIQFIFQDPFSSLNPRFSVSELIAEPFIIHNTFNDKNDMQKRIKELMETVGLAERLQNSYPHELDGGRRQRIGIARALALKPEFIVLDEPVSALDVCIQAQILNLLSALQKEYKYTYVFISHNLSVVRHVSDKIAVMYLGKIVELCDYDSLFKNPMHPYSQALLSAIPVPNLDQNSERIILEGDVPSPINPPNGCRFAGRCLYCKDICKEINPELKEHAPNHLVRCHLTEL